MQQLLTSKNYILNLMRKSSTTSSPASTSSAFLPESAKGQPTFSQQAKLPRLPIPSLESTVNRYLKSLEPLATPAELSRSKSLVEDFVKTLGPTLQKRLIEYDKKQKYSWLENIWLDRAYLSYRESVMQNVNWYMVFKGSHVTFDDSLVVDGLPYTQGQLKRAAVLTKFAYDFKRLLDEERVPVDVTKTDVLCMHQTTRMFGVTRVPKLGKDELSGDFPAKGKTAMVIIDDQIFIINVIDQSIDQIYSNLVKCVKQLKNLKKRSPPVAILTSEHRDLWARQYSKIIALNNQIINKINDALFAVCLDSVSPKTPHESADLGLHGVNGKNRWFDKCIQFFVTPNGVAGCNGEHSPCDAVIPNQMTTFVLQQYL
jgi:carnitine O-acetyltransferase